jgi:NAD(P)-dependent dehydrogenase (short-subunit alcohol dehydrogenase family)
MFLAMSKAVKYFESVGGGVILNIASIGGLKGGIAGAVYTASKHAVVGLTKNTGYMYAKKNIRCNAICPGAIATEIATSEFMKTINMDWAKVAGMSQALNPRMGDPKEIAKVAVFLASDDASFVNGQCLAVDGGWTAAM